jgi:hypothetical protein
MVSLSMQAFRHRRPSAWLSVKSAGTKWCALCTPLIFVYQAFALCFAPRLLSPQIVVLNKIDMLPIETREAQLEKLKVKLMKTFAATR